MAADATEQTTAAKAESAIQAMYKGAGKDRAAVYTGTIEEIGRWSDGSGSVVFQFTFGDHPSAFAGQWPEWAYQVARDAYLYGKQIMVVTPAPPDGQPDGDKLLSVRLVLPLHPPHQDPQPAPRRPLTRKTPAASSRRGTGRSRSRPATSASPPAPTTSTRWSQQPHARSAGSRHRPTGGHYDHAFGPPPGDVASLPGTRARPSFDPGGGRFHLYILSGPRHEQ